MDQLLASMENFSRTGGEREAFAAWLQLNFGLSDADVQTLGETYVTLKRLHDEGRSHIWGFLARNLSRPVWLSAEGQRVDVIVGNPPWLSYRFMSKATQRRFQQESRERGIWVGGNVATHADLSSYFFVKCVELYLRPGGRIGFVLPFATLFKSQFVGFRTGWWGTGRADRLSKSRPRVQNRIAEVRFEEAWVLDNDVYPLFPVPSCVLIATEGTAGPPSAACDQGVRAAAVA
jgi:hypothetical protein